MYQFYHTDGCQCHMMQGQFIYQDGALEAEYQVWMTYDPYSKLIRIHKEPQVILTT